MGQEKDLPDNLSAEHSHSTGPAEPHTAEQGERPASDQKRGLSPSELVSLSDNRRKLVTWLAHRPTASLEEIKKGLGQDLDDIEALLEELIESGYIERLSNEGEIRYRANFRAPPRTAPKKPSSDIWSRLDLDDS